MSKEICESAFHDLHDLPMEGLCKMSTFKKARFATGKHTQNFSARTARSKCAARMNILDLLAGIKKVGTQLIKQVSGGVNPCASALYSCFAYARSYAKLQRAHV